MLSGSSWQSPTDFKELGFNTYVMPQGLIYTNGWVGQQVLTPLGDGRVLLTTDSQTAEVYDPRYEQEKAEIKGAADKLEAEALQWDKHSDEQMHQHHRWAQATTVLQIAIAMAAIALLTRKKWLEYVMFGVAAIGLIVGALAVLHI